MKKVIWGDMFTTSTPIAVVFDSEVEKIEEVARIFDVPLKIEEYIEYEVRWSLFELRFESYEKALEYVKELLEEGSAVSIRKVV